MLVVGCVALRCVWEEAGRALGPPGFCKRHLGLSVTIRRETLIAVCQVAGISAAALNLAVLFDRSEF